MRSFQLKPLYHRSQESIAICFPYNKELEAIVRTISQARWSRTHRVWYVPLSKRHYRLVLKKVAGLDILLDTTALKRYVRQRKTLTPAVKEGKAKVTQTQASLLLDRSLCASNLKAYNRFIERLKLKGYSASTIKTYRGEFLSLLRLLKDKEVDGLESEHLRRYIIYCLEKEKLSEASIHSRINALKFYFEQVLGRERLFFELPRPKKPLQLPKVLAEEEIGRLFNAIHNRKHKAILFTAYSAGLRVSEVVHLKLSDVDSARMQLFIERAKGKKDRMVALSPVLLDVLRSYIKDCKPRPQYYLFEGALPNQPYSDKSAQRVFQRARQQAGISKKVSFHALRHSFATHSRVSLNMAGNVLAL